MSCSELQRVVASGRLLSEHMLQGIAVYSSVLQWVVASGSLLRWHRPSKEQHSAIVALLSRGPCVMAHTCKHSANDSAIRWAQIR